MPPLPQAECSDLIEFRAKAPADTVALVFASESLSQPSSVMGHLFLKFSGRPAAGAEVSHAISFFTDAATLNIPKLLFDSVVRGKRGYFVLMPYEEQVRHYVSSERRTVWEYTLRLDPFSKELLHTHLIELKQAELTYYFQKYNCATLIDYLLSIAIGTDARFSAGPWVSPKDVVKRAQLLQAISGTRIYSPTHWAVRALNGAISGAESRDVRARVIRMDPILPKGEALGPQGFARLELARSFHGYRRDTGAVAGEEADRYEDSLQQAIDAYPPHWQLSATQLRDPLSTPPDTQFGIAAGYFPDGPYTRLTFTPASHRLEDDNRHYFAETELALFEVSVVQRLDRAALWLDRLTLYSAKSLLPRDHMVAGLSGWISLGIQPEVGERLREYRAAVAGGGLGATTRVANDIDLYVLAGAGVSAGAAGTHAYALPEIGFITREIFDMKSTVVLKHHMPVVGRGATYSLLRATQSKYFAKQSVSLHVTVDVRWQRALRTRQFEITLKRLF